MINGRLPGSANHKAAGNADNCKARQPASNQCAGAAWKDTLGRYRESAGKNYGSRSTIPAAGIKPGHQRAI